MTRWVTALTCLGLGACATPVATGPLKAPTPPVALAQPKSVLEENAAFADGVLSPDAMIWLRASAPKRDAAVLGQLLGLGSLVDPADILGRKLGPTLSGAVDLSKPIDFTVSGFDDSSGMLLACGVSSAASFAAQVKADFELVHVAVARWQLKARHAAPAVTLTCELWQAEAPVGARLICATDAAALEQQGPFVMAAARGSVDAASLHAEMPGHALATAVKKGADEATAHASAPPKDAAERSGEETGKKAVADLVDDLGALSWDVTLRDGRVEVAQELRFVNTQSLFSASLAGRAGPVPPVPAAFWRLPADSDLALYSEGADPESMHRVLSALLQQLVKSIETDYEVSPGYEAQLSELAQALVFRGGGWELGYGQDLEQASRALAEAAEKASAHGPHSGSADPALKRAQGKLGGWALLGLEDDSSSFLDSLRAAVKFGAIDPKRRKDAPPEQPSESRDHVGLLPIKDPTLPKGSLHILFEARPNPKYVAPHDGSKPAPAPSEFHIIGVPDGDHHLWLSVAADEATATSRMHGALSAEASKTLAANDELQALAKSSVSGLGYVTIAGFSEVALSAKSLGAVRDSQRTLSRLWALASHGASHLPLWINRRAGSGGQRSVIFKTRLRPSDVADLMQVVAGAAVEAH